MVFPVRVLTKICIFDAVIVEACIVVVKSGVTIIEKDPLTYPILSHFSSVNVGSRTGYIVMGVTLHHASQKIPHQITFSTFLDLPLEPLLLRLQIFFQSSSIKG